MVPASETRTTNTLWQYSQPTTTPFTRWKGRQRKGEHIVGVRLQETVYAVIVVRVDAE